MLRVGFVTCVDLGLSCMEAISSFGGRFHLAVTLKDEKAKNKSGRVYLDSFCAEREIPLIKVDHVNDAAVLEAISANGIDWLFIVGWSQIAGTDTLKAPSKGCIGIHPTLLPGGRGRAPIPWAIIKGLTETGVTMFVLDEGVDSGPVIVQERISIGADETATTLYAKIAELHQELIRGVWEDLVDDAVVPKPQDDDLATYWPGRRPEDGEVLARMTMAEVDRLVRGVTRPYPGAFYLLNDRRMRIWSGKPVPDDAATASSSEPLIGLADGAYRPDEWEWE